MATPMLTHSSSTRQLNSYYLQEYSVNCYQRRLKMFFFLFSNSFLIWHSENFLFFFTISLLYLLISQVSVTFYTWFRWLLFVASNYYIVSFLLVSYVNMISVRIKKYIFYFNKNLLLLHNEYCPILNQ